MRMRFQDVDSTQTSGVTILKLASFRGQNDCLFVVFGYGFAVLKSF